MNGIVIPDYLHFFISQRNFDRFAGRFIDGFWVTIEIVAISFFIGFFMAIAVALLYNNKNGVVRNLVRFYMYFFRSTPLLAQLFLFYYGLGVFREFWQSVHLWWFMSSPWYCALFVFTLNTAAYQAEILRGSYQSVNIGQYEAAQALSLDARVTFIRIIMPQALILALRPLGNEFILMIKASAIASLVGVFDVMGAVKQAYSRSFDFQFYLWAAILYLLLVAIIRWIVVLVEKYLTRHVRA